MTGSEDGSVIVYPDESYAIMGACFEVYKSMGCGFLEGVYQECLAIELEQRGLPFVQHPELRLQYRGRVLRQFYQPDFICYGKIVVELKALDRLADEHRAQLLNYLHGTQMKLGLLINFGHHPKIEYERIALTRNLR